MKAKSQITIYCLAALFLLAMSCTNNSNNSDKEEYSAYYDSALVDSVPVIAEKSFKNLHLFLIGGKEEITNKNYVILSIALEKKEVTMIETSDVNELSVNNTGKNYVFIHSGDIVKGGRQDRTLAHDVIVPPDGKDVPLASFCVEASRWAQRGDESVGNFSKNSDILSSRKLKVASKGNANQSQVWDEVSKQQSKLNENISYMADKSVDVTENESATSLQLSLENKELDSIRNAYKEEFAAMLKDNPEAIGFAYAINGEVYGIELYNNKKLFNDLWEKLLDASIVESVSEMKKGSIFDPAKAEDVYVLMSKALKGKKEEKEINSETHLYTLEFEDAMLFTTVDKQLNKWVHKNYIAVDTTMASKEEMMIRQNDINDIIQQEQIPLNSINITDDSIN